MGITNMYPNLPGHLVEFKDGGLQLTSLPENTSGFNKSLLILGTALDGPVMEPVKIDAKTVTQLFGSEVNDKNYPNGATLTKYAKQAFAHGFSDVRCMRVTGTEATKTIPISLDDIVDQVQKQTQPMPVSGHPEVTVSIVGEGDDLLPISNDDGYNDIWICASPSVDGVPKDILRANGIVYSPSVGKVTLPANTVSKNATVYGVFYHQNIIGKGEMVDGRMEYTHGGSAEYFTDMVVNGNTVSEILAEDFDNGVVFKLKYPNGARLYSQAYDSQGNVLTASCYPQIWDTIFNIEPGDDVNTGVTAAMTKANGLKVIITAKYDDAGVEKTHVLGANEFTVIEDSEDANNNGKVVITNDTIACKVPNPLYDADDFASTEPEYIDGQANYKSYTVQYLAYTNDFVCNTLKLDELSDVAAEDDVFFLNDSGNAINGSVVVYPDSNSTTPLDAGLYTVEYDGVNTKVTFPAGKLLMGTPVVVKYKVEERSTSEKNVIFKSLYGGEVYNQARVKMEKCREDVDTASGALGEEYIKVTFCKPESKYYSRTEVPFYYKSTDVPTVGQLRDFLKNYELNNVFAIETDDDDITLENLYNAVCRSVSGQPAEISTQALATNTASVEFALVGGSSGINPTDEELFVALSGKRNARGYLIERGAYQILENYHCDYIYPAGARADKTVVVNGRAQSFQYELALVCAVLTYRTKMTHGFMDVSPNSNTSLVGIQKHVDKLLTLPNLFYMQDQDGNEILDSENNPMDIGWYTSVVVGPDPVMISDTLGTYYGSAAIAYAALVASLKPQSSPMNKALPKVKGMKYKFSNKQMDALIGNRMVCFRLKNEGTTTATSVPYCVDAMTAGGPNCDYARMTTVSIVTDVVDQIREVADPFIGEPNTIEQRNALSALIAKRLSRIYEKGEVTYYSFEINATVEQVLLGECTISLTLVCPMELRKITTVVSLRAAA